jgi:hypothetical protein
MDLHQAPEECLIDYYARFKSAVENTEEQYGAIAPTAVAALIEDKDAKSKAAKEKEARERVLAVMFMDGGNKGYKQLLRGLENDYTLGAGLYPTTVEDAFQVMKVYEEQPLYTNFLKSESGKKSPYPQKKERTAEEYIPEMQAGSFLQGMSKAEKGKFRAQCRDKNLCYKCGGKGHKGFQCTGKKVQYAQVKDKDVPLTEDTVFSFMA